MEQEHTFQLMAESTLDNMSRISAKAVESTPGLMEANTRDYGETETKMVMVFIHGLMVVSTMEILSKTSDTVTVNTLGFLVKYTKVNG